MNGEHLYRAVGQDSSDEAVLIVPLDPDETIIGHPFSDAAAVAWALSTTRIYSMQTRKMTECITPFERVFFWE
ncbi:MAG: hypothetical protein A3I01_04100 [Betaproteobacteria bacterium RIFCSPLOWO2_02_FULL_65_24]|nr:MAG: hypothetical protein A3I01_04100 [Betaproteobacteria bacterium RIFCSPLOWO2_02_FULL_65_24]